MNDTQNDAGKIDNELKKIHETTDFFEIFIGIRGCNYWNMIQDIHTCVYRNQ